MDLGMDLIALGEILATDLDGLGGAGVLRHRALGMAPGQPQRGSKQDARIPLNDEG